MALVLLRPHLTEVNVEEPSQSERRPGGRHRRSDGPLAREAREGAAREGEGAEGADEAEGGLARDTRWRAPRGLRARRRAVHVPRRSGRALSVARPPGAGSCRGASAGRHERGVEPARPLPRPQPPRGRGGVRQGARRGADRLSSTKVTRCRGDATVSVASASASASAFASAAGHRARAARAAQHGLQQVRRASSRGPRLAASRRERRVARRAGPSARGDRCAHVTFVNEGRARSTPGRRRRDRRERRRDARDLSE